MFDHLLKPYLSAFETSYLSAFASIENFSESASVHLFMHLPEMKASLSQNLRKLNPHLSPHLPALKPLCHCILKLTLSPPLNFVASGLFLKIKIFYNCFMMDVSV